MAGTVPQSDVTVWSDVSPDPPHGFVRDVMRKNKDEKEAAEIAEFSVSTCS